MKFLHKNLTGIADGESKEIKCDARRSKVNVSYLINQLMIWLVIGFLFVVIIKKITA